MSFRISNVYLFPCKFDFSYIQHFLAFCSSKKCFYLCIVKVAIDTSDTSSFTALCHKIWNPLVSATWPWGSSFLSQSFLTRHTRFNPCSPLRSYRPIYKTAQSSRIYPCRSILLCPIHWQQVPICRKALPLYGRNKQSG